MINEKERLKERIRAIERIEEAIRLDIDSLAFLTPLTDKQKKFLKLLKSGKCSMKELMKEMGCSRPMVYKYYEIFLKKEVVENKKLGCDEK